MLSDRLRARLAQLNREPLPAAGARAARPRASAESVDRSHVGEMSPFASSPMGQLTLAPDVDALAQCGSEVETERGKHWLIERPVRDLWDQADAFMADAARRLPATSGNTQRHTDWRIFARRFPHDCVLLDLETCGFAGSMVFLVGLIHERSGDLVLSQLLARNYAEEPAMLDSLWRILQSRGVLLTFNGKSFDWPMVADRSVLHRLDAAERTREPDLHIDLLHHARRRYRRELPNCKLQTLERFLCGRFRIGDIPGSEIPDAYHRHVRTGEQAEMQSILHHNALDLITLLQLSLRFATS